VKTTGVEKPLQKRVSFLKWLCLNCWC